MHLAWLSQRKLEQNGTPWNVHFCYPVTVYLASFPRKNGWIFFTFCVIWFELDDDGDSNMYDCSWLDWRGEEKVERNKASLVWIDGKISEFRAGTIIPGMSCVIKICYS